MSKKWADKIICTKIASSSTIAGALLAIMLLAVFLSPSNNAALAQSATGDQSQDPSANDSNASAPFTLNSTTVFKTYNVDLVVTPNANGDVNSTEFQVKFMDQSGKPVSSPITYNFSVTDRFLSNITEVDNQVTDGSGIGKPLVVKFGNPGLVEITIWTMSNHTSTGVPESANFETVVAPEMPHNMIILSFAGALGILIFIFTSRARRRHIV